MLYILHSDQNAHFFVLKKFATQFFSQAKKIDRQYMFSPLRVKIWESAPTYIGRSTIFSKYGVFLKLKKKHCLPHTHTHKQTHTHTTILHTNAGDSSRRMQTNTLQKKTLTYVRIFVQPKGVGTGRGQKVHINTKVIKSRTAAS